MNRLVSVSPTLALVLRHPGLRLGLVATLAGLVSLLGVGFLQWRPVAHEHAALEQAIDRARRAAIQAQEAHALLRAYQQATHDVAQAEQKLSAPVGQAELVTSLGRLAEAYGVSILGQSWEEGRRAGSALLLTLKLEAGYPALRAFIADLPSLRNWVEVEELRLERSRESPDVLRAQLRLVVLREAGSTP